MGDQCFQLAVKLDHLHLVLVHLVFQTLDDGRLSLQLRVDVLPFVLDGLRYTVDLVELLFLLVEQVSLLHLERLG